MHFQQLSSSDGQHTEKNILNYNHHAVSMTLVRAVHYSQQYILTYVQPDVLCIGPSDCFYRIISWINKKRSQ